MITNRQIQMQAEARARQDRLLRHLRASDVPLPASAFVEVEGVSIKTLRLDLHALRDRRVVRAIPVGAHNAYLWEALPLSTLTKE